MSAHYQCQKLVTSVNSHYQCLVLTPSSACRIKPCLRQVGLVHRDLAIEAPGPREGRVQNVRAVRARKHHHAGAGVEPVHLLSLIGLLGGLLVWWFEGVPWMVCHLHPGTRGSSPPNFL